MDRGEIGLNCNEVNHVWWVGILSTLRGNCKYVWRVPIQVVVFLSKLYCGLIEVRIFWELPGKWYELAR